MKLLIQLVREKSGKSQGISNTYGCGNHVYKYCLKELCPTSSLSVTLLTWQFNNLQAWVICYAMFKFGESTLRLVVVLRQQKALATVI